MKRVVLLFIFSYALSFCPVTFSADENAFTESLKTNRHLAETGDAEGQYQLGKHYDYGWGVERDAVEAAKWYEKSDNLLLLRSRFPRRRVERWPVIRRAHEPLGNPCLARMRILPDVASRVIQAKEQRTSLIG